MNMEKFLNRLGSYKYKLIREQQTDSFILGNDIDRKYDDRVIVFSRDEKYLKDFEKTHGSISHAILHLHEFDPSKTKSILEKVRNKLATMQRLYVLDSKNEIIAMKDDVSKYFKDEILLNTLDLINDDQKCGRTIVRQKFELLPFILEMRNAYQEIMKKYMDTSTNADANPEAGKKAWAQGKIIKFTGTYTTQNGKIFDRTIYLNPQDSGILALSREGKPTTFFRIDKKGNDIGIIRQYIHNNIKINSPEVRAFLIGM